MRLGLIPGHDCYDCASKVGDSPPDIHCTRFMNPEKAMHKRCDGWQAVASVPIGKICRTDALKVAEHIRRMRKREDLLDDKHFDSGYLHFVRCGGAYSFRTGKMLFRDDEGCDDIL